MEWPRHQQESAGTLHPCPHAACTHQLDGVGQVQLLPLGRGGS